MWISSSIGDVCFVKQKTAYEMRISDWSSDVCASDLLGAIVSMEVNEVLNAGSGVVANPPANVGDALDTLLGIYVEHSLHYLSKEMWRQLGRTSCRARVCQYV